MYDGNRFSTKTLFAAVVALTASCPAGAQILDTIDLAGGALTLGQGFDRISGEPRGFCVDRPTKNEKPLSIKEIFANDTPKVEERAQDETEAEDVGAENTEKDESHSDKEITSNPLQEVTYELSVLTEEEYERRFKLTAIGGSAGYAGIGKVSGSSTTSETTDSSATHLHVVLTVDVRNKVRSLSDFADLEATASSQEVTERPPAGDVLAVAQPESVDQSSENKQFLQKCGDSFIYAIAEGGVLRLVATIETKNYSSQRTAISQISGSGSYGGFSASAAALFIDMVDKGRMFGSTRINLYTQGRWIDAETIADHYNEDALNASTSAENNRKLIAGLLREAISYPDKIAEMGWPYRGYLMTYASVGHFPLSTTQAVVQDTVSAQLFQVAAKNLRYAKYLERVLETPSAYVLTSVDRTSELEALRLQWLEALANWKAAVVSADSCLSDYNNCSIDNSNATLPDFSLLPRPKYSDGLTDLCVDYLDQAEDLAHLVPTEFGCLDPENANYWAGPLFRVRSNVADEYCKKFGAKDGSSWRLPTTTEVEILAASLKELPSPLPSTNGEETLAASDMVVRLRISPVEKLFGDFSLGNSGIDSQVGEPVVDPIENLVWSVSDPTQSPPAFNLVNTLTGGVISGVSQPMVANAICYRDFVSLIQ